MMCYKHSQWVWEVKNDKLCLLFCIVFCIHSDCNYVLLNKIIEITKTLNDKLNDNFTIKCVKNYSGCTKNVFFKIFFVSKRKYFARANEDTLTITGTK